MLFSGRLDASSWQPFQKSNPYSSSSTISFCRSCHNGLLCFVYWLTEVLRWMSVLTQPSRLSGLGSGTQRDWCTGDELELTFLWDDGLHIACNIDLLASSQVDWQEYLLRLRSLPMFFPVGIVSTHTWILQISTSSAFFFFFLRCSHLLKISYWRILISSTWLLTSLLITEGAATVVFSFSTWDASSTILWAGPDFYFKSRLKES